jgi:uncharacterized membrane protein YphA (DoxX/SURF4 family)
MNKALWAGQIVLALAFLAAGGLKLLTPSADLDAQLEGFPAGFGKASGILPLLTPAAAGGLAVIMVGAAFTHLFRAEYVQILPPLTLLVLALFVAYGRVKVHPFTAPSR